MLDDATNAETARDLTDLIFGWWRSRLIYAGTKLGLFDLLSDEDAMTSDDAARTLGADRDALYRTMRALASIGILREDDGRAFALAPMGRLLRKDATPSLRDMVLLEGSPAHARFWSHLEDLVRDGPPDGIVRESGRGNVEYRREDPEFDAIAGRHVRDEAPLARFRR